MFLQKGNRGAFPGADARVTRSNGQLGRVQRSWKHRLRGRCAMSQTPAIAAMWGQSRAEEAAAHLVAHPAETGGWRRPVREQAPSKVVAPIAPVAVTTPHVAPAAIRRTDGGGLVQKAGESVGAGRRPAPTAPVSRRCGGVAHLRTFADYRARLGSSPIACELEDAWLSSEVWALHANTNDGEEVGAYAVAKRRDRVELTLFYLVGPSARSGEVALVQAIAAHHVTQAVVSTTDSYAMGLLLDLELAEFAPRTQVFTYGGSEPRFALLPKIQWPASPRGHPGQLQSLSSGESGSEATVRLATSSDCGRLAALLGGEYPEFSRRVAAAQLLVAALPRGDQPQRVVGAGWWTPSALEIAQEEADRRNYSTSRTRPRGSPSEPSATIRVFVDHDYRRKGVGCSLVAAVIQAVRRSGLAPVASCPSTAGDRTASGQDGSEWKSVLEAGGMVSLSRLLEVSLAK